MEARSAEKKYTRRGKNRKQTTLSDSQFKCSQIHGCQRRVVVSLNQIKSLHSWRVKGSTVIIVFMQNEGEISEILHCKMVKQSCQLHYS